MSPSFGTLIAYMRAITASKCKIDIVFANAAFVEKMPMTDVTPEHFDKTFNTNARGTYFTVQKALPLMNNGGSIILIASSGNKGFAESCVRFHRRCFACFQRTLNSGLESEPVSLG